MCTHILMRCTGNPCIGFLQFSPADKHIFFRNRLIQLCIQFFDTFLHGGVIIVIFFVSVFACAFQRLSDLASHPDVSGTLCLRILHTLIKLRLIVFFFFFVLLLFLQKRFFSTIAHSNSFLSPSFDRQNRHALRLVRDRIIK